jgi:hypothetical protein
MHAVFLRQSTRARGKVFTTRNLKIAAQLPQQLINENQQENRKMRGELVKSG